jgi:hypothetical protein
MYVINERKLEHIKFIRQLVIGSIFCKFAVNSTRTYNVNLLSTDSKFLVHHNLKFFVHTVVTFAYAINTAIDVLRFSALFVYLIVCTLSLQHSAFVPRRSA